MKISVIMLVYNRETLAKRAIESILSQTYEDFEFIIVDNGSTDRSGAIADEYAAKDARIRVIHRGCGNIGAGRNTGLDAASGEYIAFVDDDDFTEPDFLEFLYNLAAQTGADVTICGSEEKAFDEKLIMNAEEALIELMWRRRYNVQFPTKLFKNTLVENLRFPEKGKYDDIALMYKLLALSKKVAYHGLPKYTFYRHEGNNSAWTTNHSILNSETLDEYIKVYRERTEWLSEMFPDSAGAFRYFEWSFMISMVEKIIRYGIKGCQKQLEYMRGELSRNRAEFLEGGYILDFERKWMDEHMADEFVISKMSLVVTTRCNLKCRLCDEFIPMNKPFPDMTPEEARKILDALFDVVSKVELLHLSGGGEPFLNPMLAELVDVCFEYAGNFDRLMLFTNSTIPISEKLLDALKRHKDKIIVHASNYGIAPEKSVKLYKTLEDNGISLRVIKYYGENQDYGGWVDFGGWNKRERTPSELSDVFTNCGITRFMNGNWRTRDGTVHWCQRSQRGLELGILPDFEGDYVDLFSNESREKKRERFWDIMAGKYLSACDHCSGDHGSNDPGKRFPAGEQM